MKTFALLSLLSFSAVAADFECVYSQNLSEVYRNNVSIADGARDQVIADFDEYKFFMTSLPDFKYELQSLNSIEPSRTYAITKLPHAGDEISLVIWKREAIIEVSCKKL
ncbi:MAG: hypothetical protein V4598_04415 [Bdellovibrionota bacterium]